VKLNVLAIIADHFATLYDARTGKRSITDWFVFVCLPIIIGAVAVYVNFSFRQTSLSGMLSAYSIFFGLLVNLLVLAIGFMGGDRLSTLDAATTTRRLIVKEFYYNIAFAILLSIANVLCDMACLAIIGDRSNKGSPLGTNRVETFFVSTLSAAFLLTLLIVLKRIHLILSYEFNRPTLKKSA
jgi:hypothetical protein